MNGPHRLVHETGNKGALLWAQGGVGLHIIAALGKQGTLDKVKRFRYLPGMASVRFAWEWEELQLL